MSSVAAAGLPLVHWHAATRMQFNLYPYPLIHHDLRHMRLIIIPTLSVLLNLRYRCLLWVRRIPPGRQLNIHICPGITSLTVHHAPLHRRGSVPPYVFLRSLFGSDSPQLLPRVRTCHSNSWRRTLSSNLAESRRGFDVFF